MLQSRILLYTIDSYAPVQNIGQSCCFMCKVGKCRMQINHFSYYKRGIGISISRAI